MFRVILKARECWPPTMASCFFCYVACGKVRGVEIILPFEETRLDVGNNRSHNGTIINGVGNSFLLHEEGNEHTLGHGA